MVSDTGLPIPEASLATDAKLLAALDDASGEIRSAALVAGRYTEADLDALAEGGDPFLIRMTCSLAIGYLLRRRPGILQQLPADTVEAQQWLAALRFGERIFAVAETATAGVPSNGFLSLASRNQLNLISDETRFFPVRRHY